MTMNLTLTKCFTGPWKGGGRENDQEPYLNAVFQRLAFRCASLKRQVAALNRRVVFSGINPLAWVLRSYGFVSRPTTADPSRPPALFCGAKHARFHDPSVVYHVLLRCFQGRFLLRPDRRGVLCSPLSPMKQ